MLSVSMISQGVRSVAAMLSPEKNPCRVRMMEPVATAATGSWYRYDPYVSKVLASPLKTQLVSPAKTASTNAAAPDEGLIRNSLFNAPAPAPARTETTQAPQRAKSFLAAAERLPAPAPIAVQKKAATEVANIHYAIIYFKHDSATFVAPFRVKEGDHVVVEGDRGVDIGVVTEITTETPNYPVPLKVVRRATSSDMEAFRSKQRKEQVVMRQVQDLAQNLGLGIAVVDTEFQFDNNKLTVYFTAARGQIDFRKLQRGLFREHRCRIWLSNMTEVEYNANLQKTRRTR